MSDLTARPGLPEPSTLTNGASHGPSPVPVYLNAFAYQRSAALKAAVELDLFGAVARGARTAEALAEACGASARGVRMLCDYLVTCDLLAKVSDGYQLHPSCAPFLDPSSPVCVAGAVEFLIAPDLFGGFANLTDAVRRGGTMLPGEGTMEPDNPIWQLFARKMGPLMGLSAEPLAAAIAATGPAPKRILDVAAGHGRFGIACLQRWPEAEVTALDWPKVLEVAEENATAAGVADRLHRLSGSVFEVELGTGYDVVLMTNFVHHFDPETSEALLRRVRAALNEGGRMAALDFVPNEDRVTPLASAQFALTMLATTQQGDAYTFADWERMCRNAGFDRAELHPLGESPQSAVIAYR